jgi:hypothetical protein
MTLAGPKALAQFIVDHLRRRFEGDGNALYAWEALRLARRAQIPVPEWVATYLDACAQALLDGSKPAEALDLAVRGGHGKLRQVQDHSRDIGIYSRIEFLQRCEANDFDPPDPTYPMTLDAILRQVAEENHISFETARKIYHAHRPR